MRNDKHRDMASAASIPAGLALEHMPAKSGVGKTKGVCKLFTME
jgi:hypothetical protein